MSKRKARRKIKITPLTVIGYLSFLMLLYFGVYGALHMVAAGMSS